MAISLKKPVKVDLSKPELPPKVREYTPVHLLDEEETIKKPVTETDKCSAQSSAPINQVDLEGGTDLLHFRRFRFSRGLIVFFCILGTVLLVAFILLFCYFAPRIVAAILFQGSETDGQSFIDAFDNIYRHPSFIFMLLLSASLFAVRCIRKVLDVGRF